MNNINDLYEIIKKDNSDETINSLRILGLDLNTEFKIYDKTYTTMMAFLNHSDRRCFDDFYKDLKESNKDWKLEEFFYKVFYSGISKQKEGYEEEKKTLNKAIFDSLKPWNVDIFNEIKQDCLSLFDAGGFKNGLPLKREMIENSVIDIKSLFEKTYFNTEKNYLDFIKKIYNENPVEKEIMFTNKNNTRSVIWSLLYDNDNESEFLKILDWAEEIFGIKENIINSVHILQWPNNFIKLIIDDMDINRVSEESFSSLFEDYTTNSGEQIYTLKEFMKVYINPEQNKFLLMDEEESFRPERKENVKKVKERAIMFQKRLLTEGLDLQSSIDNSEIKKRL